MFYYKYKPEITNIYNHEVDLVVTAVIHIYADKNKTADGLKQYLEQKIEEVMQQWTERFEELKLAKELGLYNPIELNIEFNE